MVTKANFSNMAIDQALLEFLDNANVEITEFKSEINPGVVYKMATPDITAIDSESA